MNKQKQTNKGMYCNVQQDQQEFKFETLRLS